VTAPTLPPIDEGLIDVVVPVFNEEAVLDANVSRLCAYLERHFPFRWQVTVVDNASTDGTWAAAGQLAARRPGVRALHLDRKGRGAALRAAWETSEADVVAYMDVDLSTNLESFLPLVSPLLSGHSEVAIGTRLSGRARVTRRPGRELLSRGYNRLIRTVFRSRFSDAQCGFKALRADAARRLLPRVENDHWFFDTELLLLAEAEGMRIYEVPVDWIEDLDSRVDVPATIREDVAGLWRMRRAGRGGRGSRPWLPVGAVTLLALGLNLWALDRNGLGNSYYAAAVRSMAQSWHNFFFASFDPGGFITIDKPPLATWVQTGFVKLFGFNSWSLLLPSALAGAAAVLILYLTVARAFGRSAGLLTAFVLAVTPVSVAVNRSNNPDALLVLLVVVAAWFLQRALESGRLRHLVWAAGAMALAFNTKTLEAYIVVPALWLAYLVAGPPRLGRRLAHLTVATAVLFGLSAGWVLAVDAIPARDRPYVGGSADNSALNVAFGYNGLGRINGQEGRGHFGGQARHRPANGVRADGPGPNGAPADGPGPNGAAAGDFAALGRRLFGGQPGPTRLAATGLADQAGWLLPLSLLGSAAVLAGTRRRRDAAFGAAVLWSVWLVTAAVVFSFAQGIFHSYYLSLLAPAAAALVGIGVVTLARSGPRLGVLLAAGGGVVATALFQWRILRAFPAYAGWLVPVLAVGTAVTALALLGARRRPAALTAGLTIGLVAVMAAPAAWSLTTVGHSVDGNMDIAGPTTTGAGFRRFANGGIADQAKLIRFLDANRGGARYLVATTNALTGAPLILATGQPVMAMGGFMGSDPALTPASLAKLIGGGAIRYFLVGGGFGGGAFGGRAPLAGAIAAACPPVDDRAWGGAAAMPAGFLRGAAGTGSGRGREGRFELRLYDCRGAAAAVQAAAAHPAPPPPGP
jgi:4-amino-4-deoxy-L-arabinose transferase-like glycosyltransferase